MRYHSRFRLCAPALAISLIGGLFGAACSTTPESTPAIGEAYAGPAELPLHSDIDLKSTVTGTVHHGDKLDILSRKRRWFRVRGGKGRGGLPVEGWTDDRQLLDVAQMNRLRALAAEARNLPSQGAATTFDALNVHTEPNRLSPSFIEIAKGEKVDVIQHRVVVKAPLARHELIPPKPKPEKKAKGAKKSPVPPPPLPGAPPPPKDWLQLSKERDPADADDAPPRPREDWTLVRTHAGQTGWVLTSRLYMAIPDEVAQYAEGHRITSYFSIGKVADHGETKDVWLWTTSESLGEDHDFDSYRVFTWSIRHHRYETGFIQRRETGYFPVRAKQGAFSVCLENDEGGRVRKLFRLDGNMVHLTGTESCEGGSETEMAPVESTAIRVNEPARKGIASRALDRVKSWFGRG